MDTNGLTHIPAHRGTIRNGRIAEPGERVTCKACRKQIEVARSQAPLYGKAACESAHGNPPPAYVGSPYWREGRHAGSMACNAAHYGRIVLDFGSSVAA